MKKFEYRVVPATTSLAMSAKNHEKIAEELEDKLNEFGYEGWELIQKKDGMFFFKREVQ